MRLWPCGMGRMGRGEPSPVRPVGMPFVLAELKQLDMLPAIFFIFSRRDCDANVQNIWKMGFNLLRREERQRLKVLIDELRETQPEALREDAVEVRQRPASCWGRKPCIHHTEAVHPQQPSSPTPLLPTTSS